MTDKLIIRPCANTQTCVFEVKESDLGLDVIVAAVKPFGGEWRVVLPTDFGKFTCSAPNAIQAIEGCVAAAYASKTGMTTRAETIAGLDAAYEGARQTDMEAADF